MKIDRKFRKTLSEIPNDCKQLIEKLKSCQENDQLLAEICSIKSWNIGKCELYHWADVLDRFNSILEQACARKPDPIQSWQLACDLPENAKLKTLLLAVLQFTALLIEHSYSRHLYNSIEHLTTLLESTDFLVILSVLNLLYVFSKRSIFINRLSTDKKQALLQRLLYLAESWGGKENGLDLVKCCLYTDLSNFPASATAVNFEYTIDPTNEQNKSSSIIEPQQTVLTKTIQTKHVKLEKVHLIHENPAIIMEHVLKDHPDIPEDKRVLLYTYIRLAHSFPNYEKRKLFVQTRLQSLSILVYSGAIQEHANNLLYDGLIEELVDVLTVKDANIAQQPIPPFPEIKAASLKTLTAIIHLEKTNKLTEIIETTQAASYHGLLPTLVRKCVDHLIDPTKEPFPHQFATSLFSFLYHLATYDTGGDALVKCGIMETLLKVVNHNHNSQEFIMFVTRAVRVIDLITNLDMSSFEAHNGLTAFINRLEYEVNECRKEQPYVIKVKRSKTNLNQSHDLTHDESTNQEEQTATAQQSSMETSESEKDKDQEPEQEEEPSKTGLTCYHQRSALLKSILNFFKKAIADSSNNNVPNLGDSIRHMMEGSLPESLKHIISNADYYGPSLFLLGTDVVQLFIFQEPSQLSQLQENGLTDVILYALLKKNVPATREVLGSLPTVFSALCLNTAGLNAFIESKPFDKLFQVLLSPDYLPAMRRRRNADQVTGTNLNGASSSSGTATQLGMAMDELMRHQTSLRVEAINSIIKLLNQLIELGKNPNYICQRQSSSSSSSSTSSSKSNQTRSNSNTQATTSGSNSQRLNTSNTISASATGAASNEENANQAGEPGSNNQAQQSSSDDENNMDEYENQAMIVDTEQQTANSNNQINQTKASTSNQSKQSAQQLETIPLLDYITNIMKFVDAILSNNNTDDHCKEFVKQKGLVPLLEILTLPNLPIDFPSSTACQSVAQVCKVILNLARDPQVIDQTLTTLSKKLDECEKQYKNYILNRNKQMPLTNGSVLLCELGQSDNPIEASNSPQQTPLLHSICSVHSLIYLLITLGKLNQNDVRNLIISKWGSDLGVNVLKDLSKLYMNLIWESSMLLWLCNEEQQNQQLQQLIQLQQFQQQQLTQLNQTQPQQDLTIHQTASNQLNQLIQQLSTSTTNSSIQNYFEFNRVDLEKIRNFLLSTNNLNQPPQNQQILDTNTTDSSEMETIGGDSSFPSVSEAKAVQSVLQTNISYSKLIRPLFNSSSKLGRSLCEMFGLLVKLSAGSWKNPSARRHMIPSLSQNQTPSQSAINVATSLADISITGFSTKPVDQNFIPINDITSLHPKFRLTFYICSIGFTSSILFDEQKRPYHLMIQRFDQLGGVKALFDVFYWSLSLLNNVGQEQEILLTNPDRDRLQEGTLEFIEAWLQLIQKLVNTKNMLETRYSLNPNPSSSYSSALNNLTNAEVKKVCSFDPIKFLFKIQKEAFQALMCLWDNKSFIIRENYTLSETVLNILCQILVGDTQLKKKLAEQQQQQQPSSNQPLTNTFRAAFGSRDPNFLSLNPASQHRQQAQPPSSSSSNTNTTQAGTTRSTRELTPTDQEIIMQMISMGFSAELAQEAVMRNPPDSLELAVEYCFNHPSNNQTQTSSDQATTSTIINQEPARPVIETASSINSTESQVESDPMNEESEQKPKVIIESSLNKEKIENKKEDESQDEEIHQLDKTILDRFAATMLPGLMKILDNVPDCVYRVCDLIVVVVGKYGDEWRDNCLSFILNETCDLIKQVNDLNSTQTTSSSDAPFLEQKLASRLLLFCLLFEEMQLPCSKIVNSSNLLEKCVAMLQMITTNSSNMFKQTNNQQQQQTPVWLTSLFILIDLIEKAALSTKRKAAINEQFKNFNRVWKWYDERPNKWVSYAQSNNKTIDQAYKNGETSVRIVASRKHYIIHFNTMLQENEETLHKRPVMLSFEKPQTETTGAEQTTDSNSRPSSPLPTEIVNGLQSNQISAVIESCVELISWPVSDPDCLHAILRLILRLTRQYEYAIEFAARRGPQYILNLTQRNSFMGYASLITLIFRHICEDEKNLRLTMEKAIRLALTGSQVNIAGLTQNGQGSRELNNVLRLLGPAICRHPDLFCEVACDILRIMIKREDEAILNTTNLSTLEKPIEQQLSTNTAYCLRTVPAKLMPSTPMPDYARELVIDLLNYLVKPLEKKTEQTNTKPSDSKSKTNQTNNNNQPLISKSGVLRILSELVRSYAGCAKIVSQHVYKATDLLNQNIQTVPIINDDCNALAFLLDNLLASNQTYGDKDCPSLCRLLIVALASCNHCLDSQNALVHEVKQALTRAVNLLESNDKHIKIQAFASIINTMIETCPPIHNTGQQQQQQQQPLTLVNNMMKIMHKKGLINDLARVPLYMDLSCAKCIETINTILKPLETMTKTLNISSRKPLPQKTVWKNIELQSRAQTSAQAQIQPQPQLSTTTITTTITEQPAAVAGSTEQRVEGTSEQERAATPIRDIQTVVHSGVTSDVGGLSLATDNLTESVTTATLQTNETHNISATGDEQMVDLNMTEMEPQQTLPQDIDMLPATAHHHRRELGERVFDRVIEALNQEEDSESDSMRSDSEDESQDRIIHIESDNNGNEIHIEIGPADEDEEDEDEDEEETEDEEAGLGLPGAVHDALNNSSGEDDEENESEEENNLGHDLSDYGNNNNAENEETEVIESEDDSEEESEDDEDEHDEEEEEEDDDENIIDEEIVEGSDGRSAESDLSDDEHNASANRNMSENLQNTVEPHQDVGVIMDTTNGGVLTTNAEGDVVTTHRSNRRRRRHRRDHEDENEDDFDDEEDLDEEEDEEDMDLDDDVENEIEDENQIIEEGEEDEDENEDEDEEEEDEEENEEEEDEASEYFDAYNQMLDFINDENGENGEEDDFLTHIENIWQTHGSQSNHIVLGSQLGGNRNYQINILGGGNNLGLTSNGDGSVPPHPLSVSAVHPLLVNHSETIGSQTTTGPASALTAAGNGFQVTGLSLSSGNLGNLGSAISPILRTMRQMQSQQQGGQSRSMRFSRFVLPGGVQIQAQQSAGAPAQPQPSSTLPTIRSAALPFNTLNEILQGYETPAAALLPAPPIITAPTATSFMDLFSGSTATQPTHQHPLPPTLTAVGTTNSNTALANLNNQEFLVNLNSYNNDGFGENIGNGTTNLYIIRTPLARWNEECTVLDSHSMHHAILLNKPKITEALEKYRNEELNEKREKKLKEEIERQKKLQLNANENSAQTSANMNEINKTTDIPDSPESPSVEMNEPIGSTNNQNEIQPPTETSSNQTEHVQNEQTQNQPARMEAEDNSIQRIEVIQNTPAVEQSTEPSTPTPATEAAPTTTNTSPFQTQADREAATNFLINFVGATCSVFTLNNADERRVAIEALRMADHQRASLELQAATANENTQYPQNYVFLDGHVVEIPSGIDPSFLSALPDSLRREVIMEQLRILGIDIRNRPIPQTTEPTNNQTTTTQSTSSNVEINPEFLAALPPQIQEELLTQQRLEQQARAAAAASNTNQNETGLTTAPVTSTQPAEDDNAAFMRTLPASLRQAILFDMDHSQISALPEDLASEARALQQQHREREIDLFAAAHRTGRLANTGNSYLGRGLRISSNRGLEGIYNVASSLIHDSYMYGSGSGHTRDLNRLRRGLRNLGDTELLFTSSGIPSGLGGSHMALERARNGRQLLDHESIACLLVLLFIDDPRMNMTKLHRVVRNLCIHSPSRAWIIKALLCILEKVSGKPELNQPANLAIQGEITDSKQTPSNSRSSKLTKSPGSAKENNQNAIVSYQPSWLTMSIDGAFGSKTNVFTILKSNSKQKTTSSSKLTPTNPQIEANLPSILINQQACPAILKQILEILSTLARAANFNFFPRNPVVQQQTQKPSQQQQTKSHFWDIVVKLDQSKIKMSKLSSNQTASQKADQAISEFDSDLDFSVENSPLARLMSALDYPVLKNNPHLMDKMFTCLSYASSGIPQTESSKANLSSSRPNQPETETQATVAPTATTSGSITSKQTEQKPKPVEQENLNNEAVLSKQIELVVNVLKNKLCTQDGLQQAYTLLNNLSKINSATRNMILKHLLKGTRELGLAVCKEIETLLDEAIKFNQTAILNQPTTSTSDENMEQSQTQQSLLSSYSQRPGTSTQQNLIDSYSNLVISSPKTKQTRELQLPSMSVLVEKNSNQKFFVRLIRLIISLRETIEKEAKKKKNLQQQQQQQTATTSEETQEVPESQQLARLSTELDLDLLWNKLSECLTVLKSLSDPYAVLILQQTVEGFFYVHATRKDKDESKKRERETKETQLSHLDTESTPMSPGGTLKEADPHQIQTASSLKEQKNEIEAIINSIGQETSPDTKKFLEFALTHRTVLNHILRQTSNNLSEEPYSVLVDFTRLHTHILDFDVKRRYFRQELDKLKDSIRGDDLAIHVRRTNVFDDSFRELNRRSPDDWKHRFYIVFEGEEGQDAGGLLREWYMIISKEIFNPDYALFMINPGDRVTYMPNPSSHCNPNHLSYFRFIGHIIAKAIFDNKFLDCYFTRAFYKHILGVPVKYTDMESVDNEFYKNLVSILESDIDSLGIDLFFTIDINEFGVTQSRDLKPNGRNIKVTNENKIEYVRLVCQEKMIGSIRQQVSAFLQGFYEIIPKSLISIFNEQELELLISGLPEIDLEDLRRNTEYHKYTSSSLQIQWFWRALKSFDKEDQAKFLQFVTGTSKVPLQGFAKLEGMNGPQKFQIHRDDRDTSRLPCAHTCFNQLDLPAYENFEKLKNMLLMAIRECSTGFGLA